MRVRWGPDAELPESIGAGVGGPEFWSLKGLRFPGPGEAGTPPAPGPVSYPSPHPIYIFITLNGVRFLRPIFAGDSGSCASRLPDRWVPAPNFYEGRWFLRPTASVPAPNFCKG